MMAINQQQTNRHIRGLYVAERNSCVDTEGTQDTEVYEPSELLASCRQ